jgi:hypothetical protein
MHSKMDLEMASEYVVVPERMCDAGDRK